MTKKLFTSESVTEGHPDKVCDQVSDAVLDAILEQDPEAHVACETTATTGVIHVMGEITTSCYVDIPAIVRQVVKDIGYDDPKCGFDGNTCGVLTSIDTQSLDIAMGVNQSLEAKNGETDENSLTGAGDQGMMFGYACDETPELMPLAISLSHKLAKQLAAVRKDGTLKYLRPDGKTQVTVEYDGDTVKRVDAIVISTQHDEDVKMDKLKKDLIKYVIKPVVPAQLVDQNTRIFINPTGRFVIGGPVGDSGLTGRKIIVDTYGGYGRHGGGCFSGKDPTRWTALPPTPPAGWLRTSWPPAWQSAAKSSLPTPLVWPIPSPSWWTPLARAGLATSCWHRLWKRSLTCAPLPLLRSWTCAVPSTGSWPLMATWAGKTWTCRGKRKTAPKPFFGPWRNSKTGAGPVPVLFLCDTPPFACIGCVWEVV